MPPLHQPSNSSRLKTGALGIAVCLIALLPWWHNHDVLRDFYDYGLFINVNARLAQGDRPYADFTTPAQTAAFLLNYAAERAGGGTYVGMTRGAAALIIVSGLGLMLMLARRFNPWIAALLSLAIAVGSASQHTIAFYNPLGVVAMALVVWSFAVAPLLRRETWGWHLLAAIGLLLGGANKINFHLLACAMAAGWVIHAWLLQKPAASRGLLTLAFIAAFGLVVPIGLEIAWTGAGWDRWFYNIVQLPLDARGGRISYLFSPKLYLTTVHDYYGELRVPPVGLIGVLMPLIAIIAAVRGTASPRRGWHMMLQILAGLLAALASVALLLTNNEIAYVTFAAALVIAVGLWLGFRPAPRGAAFVAGVLLPAIILAAAGWESAWRGQRSQFGHDEPDRTGYVRGESLGPDFGYLRGLHLPPRLTGSLQEFAAWRGRFSPEEATGIFYGPGLEWLEHVWPVRKVPGLPLVASAFDNSREAELLKRTVIDGDTFHHLAVLEAWDHWSAAVQDQLTRTTFKQRLGSGLLVYRKLKPGTVSSRPLDFLHSGLGANVDSLRMITRMPLQDLSEHRRFLGIAEGEGRLDVETPARRMSAEYVLARTTPGTGGALTARLAIYANMLGGLLPRWSGEITLPENTDEILVRTDPVDGSGLPLVFTVTIPEESAGKVRAGWRGFHLADTADRDEQPPALQSGFTALVSAGKDVRANLLPPSLQDAPVYLRKVWIQNGALLMPGGGEIWVKLKGLYPQMKISARLLDPKADAIPQVQVVYYKGGRLERFAPSVDRAAGTVHFTAWSAENDGWLGILADPQLTVLPMTVSIDSANRP